MHTLSTIASEGVAPGFQLLLPGPIELAVGTVVLLVLVGVTVAIVLAKRSSGGSPEAKPLPPPPPSHVAVLENRVAEIERRLDES